MALKVKCMNENCNNYKQELNEGVEVCSLCNTPVTKFETKEKGKLGLISIIAAILGPILVVWGFTMVMFYLGAVAAVGSVVMSIISKSKTSIIISILSLLTSGSLFVYFVFLM